MTNFYKSVFLVLFPFALGKGDGYAQLGIGQEIGVVAGPVAFLTDYGLRYDLETNLGNTGMGIGVVHYINFAYNAKCDCYSVNNYFNDHFRIRSELDYFRTDLHHYEYLSEKPNFFWGVGWKAIACYDWFYPNPGNWGTFGIFSVEYSGLYCICLFHCSLYKFGRQFCVLFSQCLFHSWPFKRSSLS